MINVVIIEEQTKAVIIDVYLLAKFFNKFIPTILYKNNSLNNSSNTGTTIEFPACLYS